MFKRLVPVVLAAVTAVGFAVPGAGAQERVRLKFEPKEGRELAYRVEQTMTAAHTPPEGEPIETRTSQSFTGVFTVRSLQPDGAANMSLKFKRIALGTRIGGAGGPEESFTWEEGEEAPAEPGDPGAITASERIGRAVAASEITFRIGPDGQISDFGGLDTLVLAMNDVPDDEEWKAGLFALDRIVVFLRQLFALEGLAEQPEREVGDGWQTTEVVPIGAAGALDVETNWRLDAVENGIAKIEGSQSVELRIPTEPPATTPKAALGGAAGDVVIGWNTLDHALQSRLVEQKIELTFTLEDISLKQTQTNRTHIERITAE